MVTMESRDGFDLRIGGLAFARFPFLSECWDALQHEYSALKDQQGGELFWEIDHIVDGMAIRSASQHMAAGQWYVFAESPNAFRQWLNLVAW